MDRHLPERISISGFLSGHRYEARADDCRYFTYYETQSGDLLHSRAYRDRLENPTALTRRIMPAFTNTMRTICAVSACRGRIQGAHVVTLRREAEGAGALASMISVASEAPGATHVQLWTASESQTPGTTEAQIRPGADAFDHRGGRRVFAPARCDGFRRSPRARTCVARRGWRLFPPLLAPLRRGAVVTGRGTALVAGVSGVAGSALARHLAAIGYEVIGIAGKPPSYLSPDVRFLSADLAEPVSLRAAGQHLGAVTHVFYTAFANAPGWVAQVGPNTAMLINLLDYVEDAASGLPQIRAALFHSRARLLRGSDLLHVHGGVGSDVGPDQDTEGRVDGGDRHLRDDPAPVRPTGQGEGHSGAPRQGRIIRSTAA